MTRTTTLVLSGPKEESRSSGRGHIGTAVLCLCLLFAVTISAQQREITRSGPGSQPSFATFEAPGAGTGASQGTIPFSINTAGTIAGMYYDASNAYHGFVRTAKGDITTFGAVGAGTGAAQGTVAFSVNTAGDIAGTYIDANNVYHGFMRATTGKVATFKAPGAGTGAHQGTVPVGIDTAGEITGTYMDASNVYHGFMRAATGRITTFE